MRALSIAETHLGGVGEPIRRRSVRLRREAGERLVGEHVAGLEVEHRLEDDVHSLGERRLHPVGEHVLPLVLQGLILDLVADDGGQDLHEARVALVQRRARRMTEAAEGSVQPPVPEVDRDTDVRADAGRVRDGEVADRGMRLRIGHDVLELALHHQVAIRLLERDADRPVEAEGLGVTLDSPDVFEPLFDSRYEGDVHPELVSRERENPLDPFLGCGSRLTLYSGLRHGIPSQSCK